MNLADDLRILRELRVPLKHYLIQLVGHLYTEHACIDSELDPKQLKDLIYSKIPVERIADILENHPDKVGQLLAEIEGQELWRKDLQEAAPSVQKSSKPTDSRRSYPRSPRTKPGR